MAARHYALNGALSRLSHLEEFGDNLVLDGNNLTPTQRRALALYNLTGDYQAFTDGSVVTTGAGITSGVGTVVSSQKERSGNIIKTRIFVDMTGLASIATDGDAIGAVSGTDAAPLAQLTAALHGAPCYGRMICLETPAGGATDIDLGANTSGTIAKDGAVISGGTAIVTAGGAWAAGVQKPFIAAVAANSYIYLCSGAASAGTYTAGRFLIEIEGSTFVGT